MKELRDAYAHVGDDRLGPLMDAVAASPHVDVVYSRIDSPLGPLTAAATKRGLVALSYGEEDAALERVAKRVSPRILRSDQRLARVRRELDEYFAGTRKRFDVPVDWTCVDGFTRKVLKATARIPYGRVQTYRDIAQRSGSPRGSRATGNALGANPIPIVIPCHRVVRTGGSLGGYTGGSDKKEFLLRLENAV